MGRTSGPFFERPVLWAPIYAATLSILGTTGVIFPIGDTDDENGARTTFTTRGEVQAEFTYSEAITSFSTPPTFEGPGSIPIVTWDGIDEEADSTEENAYWSRVSAAFSVGVWINPVDATSAAFLTKFDTVGNTREWVFSTNASDFVSLTLYDENVAANPTIETTSDAAMTENAWTFVVATYDGTANASGIDLYDNGSLAASTDTDDAAFLALEDLGGTMKLAHLNATPANLFDGSMAGGPLGPFFTQIQLTADQVLRLYQLGRTALGV